MEVRSIKTNMVLYMYKITHIADSTPITHGPILNKYNLSYEHPLS